MTDAEKNAYIAAYREQEALVARQRQDQARIAERIAVDRTKCETDAAIIAEQRKQEEEKAQRERERREGSEIEPAPTPAELRLAVLREKRRNGQPLTDAELREVVDLLLGV